MLHNASCLGVDYRTEFQQKEYLPIIKVTS